MKTPEETIEEGIYNPTVRCIQLLIGSYLIAIFHPIPETLFYLVKDLIEIGGATRIHTPTFVAFETVPMINAFFSDTILLSAPVCIFCILCSAMDRWSPLKTTILGGYSTGLVYFVEDFNEDWLLSTLLYLLLMILFFVLVRSMRQGFSHLRI